MPNPLDDRSAAQRGQREAGEITAEDETGHGRFEILIATRKEIEVLKKPLASWTPLVAMISVPICGRIDPFDRIGPPPSRGRSGIYTGRAHPTLSGSAYPSRAVQGYRQGDGRGKACIAILLTAGWRKWRAVRRRTVPTSHCPEARWQDNPGAAATPSRAAVMRGNRAAISDADGHTGGGKGVPRALMRNTTITRLPRSIARHSLRQQGADAYTRGTDGSNPLTSSGEPFCEPDSSTGAHHGGPRVRIRPPPAASLSQR